MCTDNRWRLAGILLCCLAVFGCSSTGAGSYVGRNEFDTLTRRVASLETTVTNLAASGDLATLTSASSGTRAAGGSGGDILPPPVGATAASAGVSVAPVAANLSGNEKTLYQRGQSLLKQKKYDQAASVFSQMLSQYPGGKLAPNARYWLGECYYASGRFSQAAAEFNRCAADYPQSAKAPDALLKLSYSYNKLGDGPQAMAAMEQLLSQYPRSNAAAMVKSGKGGFS